MRYLRENTACRVTVGPFLDKTDGITPEVALTATNEHLTLMVDTGNVPTLVLDANATASAGSNDLVHVTGDDAGFYDLELTAAQLNYLGRAMLSINYATDHCPVFHEFMILPAEIYDAMILGTDLFDVNTTQLGGTVQTGRDIGASVLVGDKTGFSLSAAGILAIWHQTLAGIVTASTIGKLIEDFLDAAISSRSTYAGGAVASVTAPVTVGANNDKTGYALSVTPPTAAAIADAVWDEPASGHVTAGTEGKSQADQLAFGAPPTPPTAAAIADAVWDEATSGHVTAGSEGKALIDAAAAGTPPTAAAIADAVWDEPKADHVTATNFGDLGAEGFTLAADQAVNATKIGGVAQTGRDIGASVLVGDKTGFSLSTAGILAIWHQLLTAVVTTGSIGKLIKDNLDAAISSRSTYAGEAVASVTAPVTVGTNNDKTGYALSAAGVSAIWDQLLTAVITAGSIGKLIKDDLDAAISTRSTYAGGAVASVTAGVTLAADQAVNVTKWNGHAVLDVISGAVVATLHATQAAYAPAKAGDKMDIVDAPSATGVGVIVSAIWDKLLTAILTTGSVGKLIKDNLNAAVSTRSTYAGGAVASVTAAVTVGTNNDKTGYSLAADQEVNATKIGGTVQTGRDIGASVLVGDKTGFSLSAAGISAIWDQLLTAITTTGSIGKLIKDYLDAAVSTRSVYAGGAVASVTAGVTLAADQAVNVTKWNGHAVLEVISGAVVATLHATQAAYAPAKAGNAMTLTSAYDAAKNAAPENGGNIAAIKAKTDALPAVWCNP